MEAGGGGPDFTNTSGFERTLFTLELVKISSIQ
jgi:hypothetical protein